MKKNDKEYLKPSELLKNEKIKARFKNPRNIGYFVMLFSDKIDFLRTSRSILINKDLFIKFSKHCDTF
ncbi:MAG: hypothetical protein L3J35_03705 [Bacteroidales bacterium]|nr:hypothetical protein [Bacteroidales bacterium]